MCTLGASLRHIIDTKALVHIAARPANADNADTVDRIASAPTLVSTDGIEQLVREHSTVSDLLALLDSTLSEERSGKDVDDRLLLDAISQLAEFTDRVHHPKEDLAIEAATARVPALRALQRELSAEHLRVRERSAAVRAVLENALADAPVPRGPLADLGFAYTSEARRNMAFEEIRVFPRLLEVLDEEAWAAIDARIGPGSGPAGVRAAADRYERWLRALTERFLGE